MANWTLTYVDWKDGDGNVKRVPAYISDDATPQYLAGGLLFDYLGNAIGSTLLNNGRGLNTAVLNDVPVKGKLAVGDLATGDLPVLTGGRVGAGIAQRTLVADGRMIDFAMTGDGRQIVLPIGPPEDQGLTTPITLAADTTSHSLIGAQAAGVKIALWGVSLYNPSATATSIKFIDQTGSPATLGEIPVPALPGIPHIRLSAPLVTTAATAMNYQLTASLGGGSVTPFWYKTKE